MAEAAFAEEEDDIDGMQPTHSPGIPPELPERQCFGSVKPIAKIRLQPPKPAILGSSPRCPVFGNKFLAERSAETLDSLKRHEP